MRRFGLIGYPLSHSFSKKYFEEKFLKENIRDCNYQNFELENLDQLSVLLKSKTNLKGLNVTIPFKESVLSFLHNKEKVVEETGACNCIKINDGILTGYNTDVTGFRKSIREKLKPHHKKALLLGSGGASKAVQYVLKQLGIEFTIVSRRQIENGLQYNEVGKKTMNEHDLIINTTPIGMFPHIDDEPPIPYEHLTHKYLLYDLIYNPKKTKFLQKGEEQGAQILNGYQMLVIQAEESWRIWNS